MDNNSQAKIISYNINNEAICASAARISTTSGNANELFEKSIKNQNNETLIKKVLQSGHRSIIEHAVLTIAFWNVSAYVEQFFIECRLASFTVKSRRYVDFSNQGYYIPDDLQNNNRKIYCDYMDMLFDTYCTMIENDIPKEDARFLLPYSFNSNFYCTLNARELINVIRAIKCGRGKMIIELQKLADQLICQIKEMFSFISYELDFILKNDDYNEYNVLKIDNKSSSSLFLSNNEIGKVEIINSPNNPKRILETAYLIDNYHLPNQYLDIRKLIDNDRQRHLEQLSYTFTISNITLSGITHIVRHRMQSIIIPSIQNINHDKYIVPNTIAQKNDILNIYQNTLKKANQIVCTIKNDYELSKYSYYFAVSGNVMNIMTTMNARELLLFTKLRTCNRAQWEIREIAIKILYQLRKSFPELFNFYGPSCYADGKCPEGEKSCGKINQVIMKFKQI